MFPKIEHSGTFPGKYGVIKALIVVTNCRLMPGITSCYRICWLLLVHFATFHVYVICTSSSLSIEMKQYFFLPCIKQHLSLVKFKYEAFLTLLPVGLVLCAFIFNIVIFVIVFFTVFTYVLLRS